MIYRVIMDGNDILNYKDPSFVLLDPVLNMELNTAGSFEFTIPPSHPFYNDVNPLISTIEIYEGENLLWFGRPVEIKTDYWKQRQIYCEGALAFFNDSVQRPREYETISLHRFFQTVIAYHNAQVSVSRQFTVGTISLADHEVYRKLKYESTFDVLKRQCLNAEGGYLFVRREDGVNYIDWLSEMPYTCNQPVEFGLNLLDISSAFNGESIATCVLPLGETDEETGEELTVSSINNGSDVIESEAVSAYGRITKAVDFPGVSNPDTLFEDGLEYLQNTQFENLVINCTAAELHAQNPNYESFRVGQMIHCRSVPHLVDRVFPLMKLTLRLDTAAKQITLGSAERQSLSRIYKNVQDIDQQGLSEAVEEALEDVGERIDNLEETIREIPAGDLTEVSQEIDELRTNLDDLGSDLSNIDNDLNNLGADLSDLGNNLNQLSTDMGTRLDVAEGRIENLNSSNSDGFRHWVGTLSAYKQLNSLNSATLYFIIPG